MVDNLVDPLDGILVKFHGGFLPLFVVVAVTVHEVGSSLDACVCEFAYFLAVVAVPPSSVELLVELSDELGVDEVGEGVSNIARVKAIDG